jgi:hypothetical protein
MRASTQKNMFGKCVSSDWKGRTVEATGWSVVVHRRLGRRRYPGQTANSSSAAVQGAEDLALAAATTAATAAATGGCPEGESAALVRRHQRQAQGAPGTGHRGLVLAGVAKPSGHC